MTKADLSLLQKGYSPINRAYEKDPEKKYYEDSRAGIQYKELDGLKGLTQGAYDARVAAKEKSAAFKQQILDGRVAPPPPSPEQNTIADSAVINVDDKTVDGTMNKVEQSSGGSSSGGSKGGASGSTGGGSFSAGDITQNVGKVGDMNTSIINSEIGENAEVGNDKSSTSGKLFTGNTFAEFPEPPGMDNLFSGSFSSGDIDQNVGKRGDMNTTIENSTIGNNVNIGNDYSVTQGSLDVGNRFKAKRKAQAFGFSGSGELSFG